jgi:diguanylate cyclase (GGDEF)-like protein/PAS domain S-box-containing protein
MNLSRTSGIALPAAFAALLALMSAVAVLSLVNMSSVHERVQEIAAARQEKAVTVDRLVNAWREELVTVRGASTGRAGAADVAPAVTRATDEAIARAQEIHVSPDEQAALDVLKREIEAMRSAASRSREEDNNILILNKNIDSSAVDPAVRRLQAAARAAMDTALAEAREVTRKAMALVGGLGLIVIALSIWVAVRVTRRVAATEAALQHEMELAQVTLHSIGDGVITADDTGLVEYLNPAAERYTGWSTAEALGRPVNDIFRVVDDRTGTPIDSLGPRAGEQDAEAAVSVRLIDRNERECPVRYSHEPIRHQGGRTFGTILVFHDISQIRAMAQQLLWQASHDSLTGLVNRREFERRLADLVTTAKEQDRNHALMFMDLDNFKAVNDTCGHNAGDELLRQLTTVMASKLRASDTLARLGGDEFGVLLESCPLDHALRIANAVRETVREFRFVWQDKTFNVGVSIGLVPVTVASGAVEAVLATADATCYEAKKKGRDCVQVHHPGEGDASGRHAELHIVSEISSAFEHGRFRLLRQGIVPVKKGGNALVNYEVLVRMVDSSGNMLAPMAFIPAAERYNLLTSLERWVISSLIAYLHEQCERGLINTQPYGGGYYSVNLSGASINDKSFPDFVRNLLTRYRLPPGLLCFEVTESIAISNLKRAAELMQGLKSQGCRFALDDFGTGMSSFAYLKYLPVDILKIAGTFVTDLVNDPMDCAIVEAVNRIGHILGMETVAESVEDAATLARIGELGIDYAQGFFLMHPEPLEGQEAVTDNVTAGA